MKLAQIKPFPGVHCETTTLGTLLGAIGIELSEPMMFGLGEGLGFIFWNMKSMEFPFIGGRAKTDTITSNFCRNLGLELRVNETRSRKKAWNQVKTDLEQGHPVGLKLDCWHLEYFTQKIHFAGHYAALIGFDEKDAFLVDTAQQGGICETSLESLANARSEKGPMSSPNRSFTIHKPKSLPELKEVLPAAIRSNAEEILNAPIRNIGCRGIRKLSKELKPWFERTDDPERDFCTTAMLMERAGTGGALFRNLYRDFLGEAYEILKDERLSSAFKTYAEVAEGWTNIADLFDRAGKSGEFSPLKKASALLLEIADKEEGALQALAQI